MHEVNSRTTNEVIAFLTILTKTTREELEKVHPADFFIASCREAISILGLGCSAIIQQIARELTFFEVRRINYEGILKVRPEPGMYLTMQHFS